MKYHINPETGRANQCTATVRGCKFAVDGQVPKHYDTKDEAKAAYEKIANDEFGETKSLRKTKKEQIQKFPNTTPKTKFEHNEIFEQYFTIQAVQDKHNNIDEIIEKQIEHYPTQGQTFESVVDPNNPYYDTEKWILTDEKTMTWKNVVTNEIYPENNTTETIQKDWESIVRDYGPFYYVETDTKLSGIDKGQGKLF